MPEYKFLFNEKEYILNEENLDCFFNDEEKPIKDIKLDNIIELLNIGENVNFDVDYYNKRCDVCENKDSGEEKIFAFLEYHFYLFTKNCEYVISSISKDYEENSYNRLRRDGRVDNSYIVSIIVCKDCNKYSIEIEELEM